MARVLFVENRSGTYLSAAIARDLERHGVEVAFLVQNHLYRPSSQFESYVLPYPAQSSEPVEAVPEALLSLLRSADRGARYFDAPTWHYGVYRAMIRDVLDRFRPSVVFGEVTLFHEHIASQLCEERGIQYLMPSHARYPQGRFAFYEYARPIRCYGSMLCPRSDEELAKEVEAIQGRQIVPDYSRNHVGAFEGMRGKFSRFGDLARIWLARMTGERFNTPSLRRKLRLARTRRNCIAEWDKLSLPPERAGHEHAILFPLQMQPETNVESWGFPHSDQATLITQMAAALPERWVLWVKANPTPKYEMTERLISAVSSAGARVRALPRATPMKSVFNEASAVVTVTGTAGIEALFAGKPYATYKLYSEADFRARYHLNAPSEIGEFARMVESGGSPLVETRELVDHLKKLYLTSYPGLVAEPISRPDVFRERNINLVSSAYRDALAKAVEVA